MYIRTYRSTGLCLSLSVVHNIMCCVGCCGGKGGTSFFSFSPLFLYDCIYDPFHAIVEVIKNNECCSTSSAPTKWNWSLLSSTIWSLYTLPNINNWIWSFVYTTNYINQLEFILYALPPLTMHEISSTYSPIWCSMSIEYLPSIHHWMLCHHHPSSGTWPSAVGSVHS